MPRFFAGGNVEGYYKTQSGNIKVLFKDTLTPDFLKSLKFLSEDFLNFCNENEIIDCVLEKFNLPLRIFKENGRDGIIIRPFPPQYYFTNGKFMGKLKEGKWFCSEKLRNKFLSGEQRGSLLNLLKCARNVASLLYVLQENKLIIDDLSYETLLMNPKDGTIFFIAWDCIHKFDEQSVHFSPLPDFTAPECIGQRSIYNFPTVQSNNHALAVLIYMLLFHRHPLRGKRINSENASLDEELTLGKNALFIEHPGDKSNDIDTLKLMESELPYGNPKLRPYTMCGQHLHRLFNLAFIEALHIPQSRPNPKDWIRALDNTISSLIQCNNPHCEEKFFVFREGHNTRVCPYCGCKSTMPIPILNSYTKISENKYHYDNIRYIGRDGLTFYRYQLYGDSSNDLLSIIRDHISFSIHYKEGNWMIRNLEISSLVLISKGHKEILSANQSALLQEGMKIVINDVNGKMLYVQMFN